MHIFVLIKLKLHLHRSERILVRTCVLCSPQMISWQRVFLGLWDCQAETPGYYYPHIGQQPARDILTNLSPVRSSHWNIPLTPL